LSKEKNRMDISTTIGMHCSCPGRERFSAVEAVRFLTGAGFKILDFNFSAYAPEGEGSPEGSARAAECAAAQGAQFKYAHLPYNFPKDFSGENVVSFNKRVFSSIDSARRIGVKYAVIHACTGMVEQEEFCEEKEMKKAVETLTPVFNYADAAGVEVVIENMRDPRPGSGKRRYLTNLGELIRLCDALGERGVCLDTGHAHTVGQDTTENIARLGKRLKMLHINDNFAAGDDHLPPFYGTINWYNIMDGLKAAGFTGDLNYEINASRIPEELRENNAKYLIKTAEHLIEYISKG